MIDLTRRALFQLAATAIAARFAATPERPKPQNQSVVQLNDEPFVGDGRRYTLIYGRSSFDRVRGIDWSDR
jgi:hypothetical protein